MSRDLYILLQVLTTHSDIIELNVLYLQTLRICGPGYCSRYRDSLRDEMSGDLIPAEARLFAAVQTGPGIHTASCKIGKGPFSGGKFAGLYNLPPTHI